MFGVAHEIAFEEQEGGIGFEALDHHDILSFRGITGFAPFDLFREAAGERDLPELFHFGLPIRGFVEQGVYLGIHMACFSFRSAGRKK